MTRDDLARLVVREASADAPGDRPPRVADVVEVRRDDI